MVKMILRLREAAVALIRRHSLARGRKQQKLIITVRFRFEEKICIQS